MIFFHTRKALLDVALLVWLRHNIIIAFFNGLWNHTNKQLMKTGFFLLFCTKKERKRQCFLNPLNDDVSTICGGDDYIFINCTG